MSKTQLECALDALRRGLKVFPCGVRVKEPNGALAPHGVQSANKDEKWVRECWTREPNGNIGVTGGVILDCDEGLNSLEAVRNFATINGLPETLTIRTGRRPDFAVQLHFSGAAENRHYTANGVSGEIRSRNQYGLFAGSVHPLTGERYEIIIDAPIAPWPAGSHFGNARSAHLAAEETETNAYHALEIFERLLNEAAHAGEGSRNYTAHRVAWFAARASLAGVFKLFGEPEEKVKRRILDAVAKHYHSGERDVHKMLHDSWRYGLEKGRLALDIYPEDLDRLFQATAAEDHDRLWRLLYGNGNTSDFPSAVAARDWLTERLRKAGFAGKDLQRVLRYSQVDDAVALGLLAELEVAEFLSKGNDDGN